MFKISNWLNVNLLKLVLVVFFFSGSLSVMSKPISKEFQFFKSDLISSAVDFSIVTEGAVVDVTHSRDPDVVLAATVEYESSTSEPIMVTRIEGNRQIIELRSWQSTNAKWNIALGDYNLDTDLSLNLRKTKFTGELGGLSLRSLRYTATGEAMTLSFSEPTTRRVETIVGVTTNTISKFRGLGQTDFVTFNYSATGASSNIDLSGNYGNGGDHTVFLNGIICPMTITAPKEVGEEVHYLREGAPIRFMPAAEWTDGMLIKRSVNFNEAKEKIKFWVNFTGADTVFEIK